tara:strand:+ start:1052 stop:1696 length:645 start_codon:yes stop_codon:yes gene_type:complete
MLYVFAGFPKNGLNASGLQLCIETVEELGIVAHDPAVQYRKEGVFATNSDEELYPLEVVMSSSLERDGITWDWFPPNHAFGNGVTVYKSTSSPEFKLVVHGTELNLDEFMAKHGTTRLAELELERMHIRHEGWQEYEARWLPGTCPQESHVVHLTWLVTTHKLPDFAYQRIRSLIEDGAEPEQSGIYVRPDEPGKYISVPSPFKEQKYAISQHS